MEADRRPEWVCAPQNQSWSAQFTRALYQGHNKMNQGSSYNGGEEELGSSGEKWGETVGEL